jgi:hypothetical protein
MTRICAALATFGFVVAGLTACTSHSAQGTLNGQYAVTGGPSGNVDHAQEGTIWIWAGHITVTQALGTSPLMHVVTGGDGRFSVRLKWGDYTVLGSPGTSKVIEASTCAKTIQVKVDPNRAATANLDCAVL